MWSYREPGRVLRGSLALQDVSPSVKAGSVVALLGRNGVGKSTTCARSPGSCAVGQAGSSAAGSSTRGRASPRWSPPRSCGGAWCRCWRAATSCRSCRCARTCGWGRTRSRTRPLSSVPTTWCSRSSRCWRSARGRRRPAVRWRATDARHWTVPHVRATRGLMDEPSLGLARRVFTQIGLVIRDIASTGVAVVLWSRTRTWRCRSLTPATSSTRDGWSLKGRPPNSGKTWRLSLPTSGWRSNQERPDPPAVGLDPVAAVTTITGGQPFLSASDIHLSFGAIRAIWDVGLQIEAKEFVAVIGPNGADKTSLFNGRPGSDAPEQGSATLDGVSLLGLTPRKIAELALPDVPEPGVVPREVSPRQRHDRLPLRMTRGVVAAALGPPNGRSGSSAPKPTPTCGSAVSGSLRTGRSAGGPTASRS